MTPDWIAVHGALITMRSLNTEEPFIASITIRNLDAHTMARLRVRAAHRQRK